MIAGTYMHVHMADERGVVGYTVPGPGCVARAPAAMFPLTFQGLCAYNISFVQHRTQLYLKRSV